MPKIEKQRSESKAKAEIARQILNHDFSPGETVSENQIAQRLGMSRTPVRTAIRELISEGLIERIEPKGFVVAKLNGEDRRQIFMIRREIEGFAAELAATQVTPVFAEQLERMQIELEDIFANWNRDRFTDHNERFHTMIAEASGNVYVKRFLKQCYWRSQLYIYSYDAFFRTPLGPQQQPQEGLYGFSYYDHGNIAKAILNGDPETARKAMECHIQNSFESLHGKGWDDSTA
jgi:DNA-binding GntR family transcriptional regulator